MVNPGIVLSLGHLITAKFINDWRQRVYKLTPEHVWISDAEKDRDGDYILDYRIEVPIRELQLLLETWLLLAGGFGNGF